jgi:hypothetical protein
MDAIRSRKYLVLLLALVAVTIAQSLPRRAVLGPVASDAMIAAMLIGVVVVVFERRRERAVGVTMLCAALLAMVLHYALTGEAERHLRIAYHGLAAVTVALAVATILAKLFRQQAIRLDDVLGVVCGYILAAGAFANLYSLVEALMPGSFAIATSIEHDAATWHGRIALFDYFSLVTLTTMGYGDVTPVRGPATALATLEAVFGQFYIAVVVAELVGARLAHAAAGGQAGNR